MIDMSFRKIRFIFLEVMRKQKLFQFGSVVFLLASITLSSFSCSNDQKPKQIKEVENKVEKVINNAERDLELLTKKPRDGSPLEKNIVKGFVVNSSANYTYTNIRVEVGFYDEQDKFISGEERTIPDPVMPGKMEPVKLDVGFPEGTEKYRMKFIAADAEE